VKLAVSPGCRERRSGLHAGIGDAPHAAGRAGASCAEDRRAIALGACRCRLAWPTNEGAGEAEWRVAEGRRGRFVAARSGPERSGAGARRGCERGSRPCKRRWSWQGDTCSGYLRLTRVAVIGILTRGGLVASARKRGRDEGDSRKGGGSNEPIGDRPSAAARCQPNRLDRFWRWLQGKHQEDRATDPYTTLYRSCHITARCRYNAAVRLKRLGSFSFFTATALSLGLILIPLLQLSGIQLSYPSAVLNMVQIFLAVAVLVYSVINSSAHYETRAQALNDCGDRMKELNRELRTDRGAQPECVDLTRMNHRYSEISTDSENHTRADYWLTTLQAQEYYHISGARRLALNLKVLAAAASSYAIPAALILLMIVVVLDILGVTAMLTPTLAPGAR